MIVEKNKSLKSLNTFGFDRHAEYFCEPATVAELHEAIDYARAGNLPVFMLGAGSNIVLAENISGLIIKLGLHSIQYSAHGSMTRVRVDAGVNWHSLVLDSVSRDLYGLENLTLIPGNCGAAPMQNIGAYGTELKDVLVELSAIHLHTQELLTLGNADCQFGYRDSIFKRELAGELAIVSLQLELSGSKSSNTRYEALRLELERRGTDTPSAQQVSDAVAFIRRSKLPDPDRLGNAGSFFKNPTIATGQLEVLLEKWPALPHHSAGPEHSRIPAAWLIEQAGWKGYRAGDVGVHNRQSLVLVNYGHGTGKQLLKLADNIKTSVANRFGIVLQQEPQTI